MRWQRRSKKEMDIFLDDHDQPRDVLRAIARASFELARPSGLGRQHFDGNRILSNADADLYINLPDGLNSPVDLTAEQAQRNHELAIQRRMNTIGRDSPGLMMDYVQGRLCKTAVWLWPPGQGTFMVAYFERCRGLAEPMLQRAVEILSGKITSNYTTSDAMFKGQSLDLRAAYLDLRRVGNVSDWVFRQHLFLAIHHRDSMLATEFLYGAAITDLPFDQRRSAELIGHVRLSPTKLRDYLEQLEDDSSTIRWTRFAGQLN